MMGYISVGLDGSCFCWNFFYDECSKISAFGLLFFMEYGIISRMKEVIQWMCHYFNWKEKKFIVDFYGNGRYSIFIRKLYVYSSVSEQDVET